MSNKFVRPSSAVSPAERMMTELNMDGEALPPPEEQAMEKPKRSRRFKDGGMKFVKFMFSRIGLIILLCVYAVLGAYMFEAIEGGSEYNLALDGIEEAKRIEENRKQLVSKINAVRNCFHSEQEDMINKVMLFPNAKDSHIITYMSRRKCRDDQAFAEVQRLIREYHNNITLAIKKYGYKGTVPDNVFFRWTFPSALLFTATVMTMIGYGHVFPVTETGKFLVIPFALLGIPLTLIFMGRIGGAFAMGVRHVYGQGCCFFFKRKRNRTYQSYWVKSDGTLSKNRLNSISHDEYLEEQERRNFYDIYDEDIEPVPIILSIGIMLSYIFFGALLFMLMENWTIIGGAYFSLVTLTTIGFGDLVPGFTEAGTLVGKLKLMTSVAYIIVGLAVLSMGFDLIVNEIMSKARRVGRLAGLVETGEDLDGDGIDDLEEEKLRRRKGNLVAAANRRTEDNPALAALMGNKKKQKAIKTPDTTPHPVEAKID